MKEQQLQQSPCPHATIGLSSLFCVELTGKLSLLQQFLKPFFSQLGLCYLVYLEDLEVRRLETVWPAWPAPGFMTPVFAPVLYISSSADCALRWIFPMPVYLYNLNFLHLIFHSNNLFLQLLLTFSLVLNTLRDSPACYSWFKITGSYSISIYHFLVTLYNIHDSIYAIKNKLRDSALRISASGLVPIYTFYRQQEIQKECAKIMNFLVVSVMSRDLRFIDTFFLASGSGLYFTKGSSFISRNTNDQPGRICQNTVSSDEGGWTDISYKAT